MQIAISTMSLNNEDVKTANGRDIYRELCVKKDYSSWVKAQIERADLVENTDYVKVTQKGELSVTGQTSIEHLFVGALFNTHLARVLCVGMIGTLTKGE